MQTINIAISASSSYIPHARVMMATMYSAHPKNKFNLFVFYLDHKVRLHKDILKRQSLNHNKSNTVNFIRVDYEELKKVDNGKGWAIDLWCRWKALDFLANDYDRVLLLGVDTFVRSDISEFYFQNMTSYYFACTPDMYITNTDSSLWPKIKEDMDRMELEDRGKYINGDVVLVNLSETRAKLSFGEFLDIYVKNQFTCWDQDVITYCLAAHVKFQDSYKYNYFPNLNLDNVNDAENIKDVKILHFAGGPKPWLVPPWEAKKFNGISEWWAIAKREGYVDLVLYLRFAKRAVRKFFI